MRQVANPLFNCYRLLDYDTEFGKSIIFAKRS